MSSEHVMETDLLVIGGGMAGCFAAVKAKEQGVDVIMVDKGYAGKSGSTPFASTLAVFNPEWGHRLEELVNYISKAGDYIKNRQWTETVDKESPRPGFKTLGRRE